MGLAKEAHIAAWKGRTMREITKNETRWTDLNISRGMGGIWELTDLLNCLPADVEAFQHFTN